MKQNCKFCKSEIDSECYVCPVCRQWLHPFRLRRDNPVLRNLLIYTILFIAIMYVPRYFVGKYFLDKYQVKEPTSTEIQQLKIISHKTLKDTEGIAILGEIKNESGLTFSSVSIEAAIYDKNGSLIDVESSAVVGDFIPGDVRVFKIIRCCSKSEADNRMDDFENYKLKVVSGLLANSTKK